MPTPPNDRPDQAPQLEPELEPERTDSERRNAAPLIWLLLLIAVAAAVWYFASQRDGADAMQEPVSPQEEAADEDDVAAADDPPASAAPAPPAEQEPVDRGAEALTRVSPAYPAAAMRSRQEGSVLLRVQVDAQGTPTEVEIERSSHSRELDRAAIEAVREWTFSPAIQDGQPAASMVTVPVDFTLEQ